MGRRALAMACHNRLVRSVVVLVLMCACGGQTLKAPASDKNFDDSDDPGQTMMGTPPRDGSTDGWVPDGQGKVCTSSMECASPLRCSFPIALGCTAKGQCALWVDPPMCSSNIACGCDEKNVPLCSPDGTSPSPIKYKGPCATDSGAD